MGRKTKTGGPAFSPFTQPADSRHNPDPGSQDSDAPVSGAVPVVQDDAALPDAALPDAGPERDARGRFLPGNRTSRLGGRPANAKATAYLNVMWHEVTEDHWRAIIRRAIADAIDGDRYTVAPAREWLSNYLLGKPAERVELGQDEDSPLARVLSVVADALMSRAADAARVVDVQPVPQVEPGYLAPVPTPLPEKDARNDAPDGDAVPPGGDGGDAAGSGQDVDR